MGSVTFAPVLAVRRRQRYSSGLCPGKAMAAPGTPAARPPASERRTAHGSGFAMATALCGRAAEGRRFALRRTLMMLREAIGIGPGSGELRGLCGRCPAHVGQGAAGPTMRMQLCGAGFGRLGTLSGLGRSGAAALALPGCLLYTRTGSAPHLTHDTLRAVRGVPAAAQLTLPTV